MLRPASFPHGLVFVLFAGAMLTSSCGPAQPLRNPEQRAGDGSSSDDVAAEVRALESRVEELEKSLRAIEATAPAGTARLPDVATLFEILGRLDGPAMFRTLETLLLSGEDGFSVIHQFLHEADLDRPRILTLTHDPQLVFGLLRLVGLHVAEVAELSAYLMDATARRPQSFIRREIFNFLPVFLNHHRGRFPELRRRLEEDIVQQLEMGGDYLYKVSLAIRDLEFQPPVEPLEGILRDPARAENHGTICDYLARGGPDGLRALMRFVDDAEKPRNRSVSAALSAILGADDVSPAMVLELLEHPDRDIRAMAFAAYYSRPREDYDLSQLLEFLNSDALLPDRQRVVRVLAEKNRPILKSLQEEAARIADARLREFVERGGVRKARRRGGKPPKKESRSTDSPSPGVSGSPRS